MSKFAILMYEDDQAWSRLSGSERERLMGLYRDFVKRLRERSALVGGEPIGAGGRVLVRSSGPAGRVEASEFTQSKQVLTGFFIVEAADLEAAAELAGECPALLHGETVVVRPVGHED